MNPKDMTNECLLHWHGDTQGVDEDNPSLMKAYGEIYYELLRRLDEADALRKENEELKEKIYFFARTFRYYAGEAFRFYEKHPLARETDETRAANIINESEASHE